jgi:hypothetical protein
MDYIVLSWIYSTISSDLEEIVREHRSIAHTVWLALEHQFLGNHESRAPYLDATF